MNGNWFWWSWQPRFTELWQQMFERLSDYHGLNNLIWVYGVNYPGGQHPVGEYYPGHSYVDVLSTDVYTLYGHTYDDQTMYNDLLGVGGGRPIGIAENGQMPDVSWLKNTYPAYTFFCTWWGFEDDSSSCPYNTNYSDAYTLTRDEVDYLSVPPGPTTTPPASPGDVNGDGDITIVDALMIAQSYVGLNPPGFIPANGDVNCDGGITIVDALMIARYYVGLRGGFSC